MFPFNVVVLYRVFIEYFVFSKNFKHFCDLSLANTRRKWPANKSDCVHSYLISDVLLSYMQGWVAVNWDKTQFLMSIADNLVWKKGQNDER